MTVDVSKDKEVQKYAEAVANNVNSLIQIIRSLEGYITRLEEDNKRIKTAADAGQNAAFSQVKGLAYEMARYGHEENEMLRAKDDAIEWRGQAEKAGKEVHALAIIVRSLAGIKSLRDLNLLYFTKDQDSATLRQALETTRNIRE